MSRQRAYQLRKIAKGLCVVCTEPRVTSTRCERHVRKQREYHRAYNARHPWITISDDGKKARVSAKFRDLDKQTPCARCGLRGEHECIVSAAAATSRPGQRTYPGSPR